MKYFIFCAIFSAVIAGPIMMVADADDFKSVLYGWLGVNAVNGLIGLMICWQKGLNFLAL